MDSEIASILFKLAMQFSMATMCLVALCGLAAIAGDQPHRRR